MSIEERLAALEARLAKLEARPAAPAGGGGGGSAATDSELDAKFGDREIKRMPSPKYWPGEESFLGKRMSECSPEFLDAFARYKDACSFMKEKSPKDDKDLQYAQYDKNDARLARGWAKRIRERGPAQVTLPGAAVEEERYGTSGHGASAKHSTTPETPSFSEDDFADDGIPF
jgi:hypothetical protein